MGHNRSGGNDSLRLKSLSSNAQVNCLVGQAYWRQTKLLLLRVGYSKKWSCEPKLFWILENHIRRPIRVLQTMIVLLIIQRWIGSTAGDESLPVSSIVWYLGPIRLVGQSPAAHGRRGYQDASCWVPPGTLASWPLKPLEMKYSASSPTAYHTCFVQSPPWAFHPPRNTTLTPFGLQHILFK
jgi:hypothetical protein